MIRAVSRIALVLLFAGPPVVFAQADSVQATDARGATLRLARPAQRIITLAPNLTELAFAPAPAIVWPASPATAITRHRRAGCR